MVKKMVYVISLVVMLSMASRVLADLVAHFPLDEGSGTVVHDVVGNVNNGQLDGDAHFVVGHFVHAVSFDGDGDSIRWDDDTDLLDPGSEGFTVTAWLNQGDGTSTHAYEFVVSKGNRTSGMIGWSIWTESGSLLVRCNSDGTSAQRASQHFADLPAGEWLHVALVIDRDAEQIRGYLNGDNQGWTAGGGGPPSDSLSGWGDINSNVPLVMGQRDDGNGTILGIVDDVRIYDHALSEAEILSAMSGEVWPYAFGPDPGDGATHEDTWVTLSWKPGQLAVSHDVYLGDDFDVVSKAGRNSDVFRGNQTTLFYVAGFPGFAYPEGLFPGTTYYWRIDEVNDANSGSPWKGDVWSFSVPPRTAFNPDPADGAEYVDLNMTFTWTGGYGSKLHTVYLGDNYEEVDSATAGSPVGTPSYDPDTLEREKILYWRVDEFDGSETHKGDIWSFSTPGAVGNPQPANGAVDVPMIETLSWTAADNAASHELYFGTDREAVNNATKSSPEYIGPRARGSESYDPGKLDWDTDYYWRVDEVYTAEIVKGLVWSFETADFILVDDFESYNDVDPPDPNSNRIFDVWIDGFGTTTNGALVGNDLPPYAEQNIVHGGAQSMIYRYDNAGKTSEATLTLVWPLDWTGEGVTQLSLWQRGALANSPDHLFVALNGTAVVYHDDPAATQLADWSEWVIDLAAFGVNLTNVNTVTIGTGTKNAPAPDGGTGTLYFDDIRLIR